MTDYIPPESQVNEYAVFTEKALALALRQIGITECESNISPKRLKSCAYHFLRDMYRIESEQRGTVSATKFAGYWAFWIRKVKPIGHAYDPSNPNFQIDRQLSEIDTINELMGIDVAINFLADLGKGNVHDVHDFIRFDCANSCDGASCLRTYAKAFFNFHDGINQKYLINSLAHRTFGPHHLTIILENLVYAACRGRQAA